jgi:hypothetical protein
MSSTKPTSESSISDLAPFVAAVLKDKIVMDLKKENEELRKREDERLLVEITGRGGTPVHYQASLKDGFDYSRNNEWIVNIEDKKNDIGEDIVLPLNSIADLEVRLGGIIMVDMKYAESAFDLEEEPPMITTMFRCREQSSCPVVDCVFCKVGPVNNENSYLDSPFSTTEELARIETPLDLIFTGVQFNKRTIGSLLSMK